MVNFLLLLIVIKLYIPDVIKFLKEKFKNRFIKRFTSNKNFNNSGVIKTGTDLVDLVTNIVKGIDPNINNSSINNNNDTNDMDRW